MKLTRSLYHVEARTNCSLFPDKCLDTIFALRARKRERRLRKEGFHATRTVHATRTHALPNRAPRT